MFSYKKSIVATLVSSAIVFASLPALAGGGDTRSIGMGGIGASTSHYLTAPFHNPALVARYDDSDDFGLLIPTIGVQAADEDDLMTQLDDFSDLYDDIGSSQDINEAQKLVDSLTKMKGAKAFVKADVAVAIAIPNEVLSFNFFVRTQADGFVLADIDSNDLDPNNLVNPNHDLKSQGITMGVNIAEMGISLAKKFDFSAGTLYVGVTPKYQQVTTINYIVSIDDYDFENWDDDQYQNEESGFNADIGLGYEFTSGFAVGMSAINLISQEYKTAPTKGVTGTYEVAPIYTVSASYNSSFFTVGIDADLNETERYTSVEGTDQNLSHFDYDNTQFVGLGAEINALDWMQIRAGYQHDIAGNIDGQYSAGLGFSPFGTFHIDVSGTYAGENSIGGAVQTYLTF